MESLPEHIADLIRQGRKIEAIRLLREETGVSLARAKEAVERIGAGLDPLPPAPGAAPDALDAEVLALARSGRKVEAIKRLREQTGLGLKEAKERVDAVAGTPQATARAAVAAAIAILLLVAGVVLAVFVGTAP